MHGHDGDDQLLATFKHLGIDLVKPRELNFYFVFPNESNADQACQLLAQKKLEAEKFPIPLPWWKRLFAKPAWTVSVTRTMPLDEAQIKQITTQFQQIATKCGGDYDGWEANVMGDQIDADRLQGLQ